MHEDVSSPLMPEVCTDESTECRARGGQSRIGGGDEEFPFCCSAMVAKSRVLKKGNTIKRIGRGDPEDVYSCRMAICGIGCCICT